MIKYKQVPSWAVAVAPNKYGNVTCAVCGFVQSPFWRECIQCCTHDVLSFTEEWHGSDDGGGWEIEVECKRCGKNCDFSRDLLMRDYEVVRKTPNV